MKKVLSIILLLFLTAGVWGQSIITGDSTKFFIGAQSSFFAGGDTRINGTLTNEGTIVSYSDLDLGDNTDAGNLKFVGVDEQSLLGDSIIVNDIEVAKEGTIILASDRLVVQGDFEVTNGIVEAQEENELLVNNSLATGDQGYVSGNMVGFLSSSGAGGAQFPMGINGFTNYVTLSGDDVSTLVRVECKVPDLARLRPTEDMVGIADEMEWIITSLGDSLEINISAAFSGIDLTEFSNGEFFRAQSYSPALVKLGPQDTVYQFLGILEVENTDNETFGSVSASRSFTVSSEPTYVSIALIPELLTPEFFVPNAFSPTGIYEENRVFRPYFAGALVEFAQIQVWDSFQNSLYSISQTGTDIDLSTVGWNGKLSDGQIADQGVYYFAVKIEAGGQTFEKTGSFLLSN